MPHSDEPIESPDGDYEIRVWTEYSEGAVGYRVGEIEPVYMSPKQAEIQVEQMRKGSSKLDGLESELLARVADRIEACRDELR